MVRKLASVFVVVLALAGVSMAGISVYTPTNGQTVSSPVHMVTWAGSVYPITGMRIYVDGVSVYATSGWSIDAWVPMSPGWRNVVIMAWDASGAFWKTPMSINVSGGGSSTASSTTTSGNTYYDIDQWGGWESCSVCAGHNGTGPVVSYSSTQGRASPSLDGKSMEFWLGSGTPYSNALWWKQVTAQPGARNFIYDLYFYLVNPGAPQALEFDVNQSVSGQKFIFGTECDIRGSHVWRVWDTAGKRWVPTGIGCGTPSAYSWHHLTLEFQRTGEGKANFVAITLDGNKRYLNWSFWPIGSGVSELNIAYQMDGNGWQTPYSTWLDKVKLTYW